MYYLHRIGGQKGILKIRTICCQLKAEWLEEVTGSELRQNRFFTSHLYQLHPGVFFQCCFLCILGNKVEHGPGLYTTTLNIPNDVQYWISFSPPQGDIDLMPINSSISCSPKMRITLCKHGFLKYIFVVWGAGEG